ncbi:MAG: FHA domain-containing protein [Planctomycetota bacterium]|nr:FHA domain-containing protein [Planctomycetota bacterium]
MTDPSACTPRLVLDRGGIRETYRMIREELSIGRSKRSTIVIDDNASSRHHCKIIRRDGEYVLADLGSRNGTLLQGVRVEGEKSIEHGHKITIGTTDIVFYSREEDHVPEGFEDAVTMRPGQEDVLSKQEDEAPSTPEELDQEGPQVLKLEESSDDIPGVPVLELEPEEPSESEEQGSDPEPSIEAPSIMLTERFLVVKKVEEGEDAIEIPLDPEQETTIGRKSSNLIQLKDQQSSGMHARIVHHGGHYWLEDVGSTNGTLVNGDKVNRIRLSHGDLMTFGGSRFYFQKVGGPPPVSGEELARMHELSGARQRVVSSRGRGVPFILLSVLVGGVLVGGTLVFHHHQATALKNHEQGGEGTDFLFERNLLPDPSFEVLDAESQKTVHWNSSAPGVLGTRVKSRTASSSLRFGPLEGIPIPSSRKCVSRALIPVTVGKSYEVSGWIWPTHSRGLSGIVVQFRSKEDPTYRRSVSLGWIDGVREDWEEIGGEVAPPLGSTHLQVLLMTVGDVSDAYFEDVVLRVRHGGARRETIQLASGSLRVESDECGIVTVARGRQVLIADLRCIGSWGGETAQGSRLYVDQFYSRTEPGYPKVEGTDTLILQSRLFDFVSGHWLPFSAVIRLRDRTVAIGYRLQTGGLKDLRTIGVRFQPEPAYFSEKGTGIVGVDEIQRRRGQFEEPDVRQLSWVRADERFDVVSPIPALSRLVMVGTRPVILQSVGISGSAPEGGEGRTFLLEVRTGFVHEKDEYDSLCDQFRNMESDPARRGEAMKLLRKIQLEFPFQSGVEEFGKRLEAISGQAQESIEELEASLTYARFFQERTGFEKLATRCAETEARLQGTEFANMATRIRLAANEELIRLEQRGASQEGQVLFRRARDCQSLKKPHLAALFYLQILDRYPQTPAANDARRELQELGLKYDPIRTLLGEGK